MKSKLNKLIQYTINSVLLKRRLNYLLGLKRLDRNAISWERCIVIQGPITSYLNLIAIIETTYKNNNSRIVVSTWKSTSSVILKKLENYVDHIILNEDIEASEFNVNRQVTTTFSGLVYAKDKGCKLVIKNRTDCVLTNNQLFDFYQNHVSNLDNSNDSKAIRSSNRIVVLDFYSSKYKLYHLSDFFMLGEIDDLLLFWSHNEINVKGPDDWGVGSLSDLSSYHLGGEGFLYDSFINKVHWSKKNTLVDYYNFIRNYFYLIDSKSAGWKWLKNSLEIRYPKSKRISDEDLSVVDWYNIYYGIYNFDELEDVEKITTREKDYYYR